MKPSKMLPLTLLALMSMRGSLPAIGGPVRAPDIEDLKLPDTSDAVRVAMERERHQRTQFPSRKKRMKAKEKTRVVL